MLLNCDQNEIEIDCLKCFLYIRNKTARDIGRFNKYIYVYYINIS